MKKPTWLMQDGRRLKRYRSTVSYRSQSIMQKEHLKSKRKSMKKKDSSLLTGSQKYISKKRKDMNSSLTSNHLLIVVYWKTGKLMKWIWQKYIAKSIELKDQGLVRVSQLWKNQLFLSIPQWWVFRNLLKIQKNYQIEKNNLSQLRYKNSLIQSNCKKMRKK